MLIDLEKAQIMFKLARKNNWGAKYDRTEHFKRFKSLKETIKELSKKGWIIIYQKGQFTGISLNSHFRKEIIDFIVINMPYVKGMI